MMKKALFLALALIGCAACSPSSRPVGGTSLSDTTANTVDAGAKRLGALAASTGRFSFAALPDRGDLVAYPSPTPPRRDGAYTWHRAELSEAHAFQSLQSGSLRITSPSGRLLDYVYVRHVEHPSGDWTWVGRLRDGAPSDQAVVTFGEHASFGSIAEPGGPELRLVTHQGAAWLIETDPLKVAQLDNAATRPLGPDFLVPPKLAAVTAASALPVAAHGTPVAAYDISASATTIVDVVVGYTTGFASALGGTSPALTRINNLVEITNQAYANSQIDARIRLVHAMAVNYPDNTANKTVLEELTGYRAGTGGIAVPSALQPLRTARETYGGDLVTLVRAFRNPENDGCGIAWLLGGGRSGIDQSDSSYGYAIVSDGRDLGTDGKTYFCREETFAHELGHNMGSQHDVATATDAGVVNYGAYSYSFGYKTGAAAGNFYTVMAYGDSGQVTYRVFSNPASTFCGGRACGVANQADNSRSLRQTIPIISMFRASGAPVRAGMVRNDIDNNRRSELLWYHPTQKFTVWFMNGGAFSTYRTQSVTSGYTPVTTGDYNADGRTDVLWRNAAGNLQMWLSGSTSFVVVNMNVLYPSGWSSMGSGDVDGDGKSELLWYHPTQKMSYWIMNGAAYLGYRTQQVGAGYTPVTNGDYNADNRLDILWRNSAGNMQMWLSTGTTFTSQQLSILYPAGWSSIGSGDVDADGRSDLLWYHPTRGVTYWIMNGPTYVRYRTQASATDHVVVSTGDYNNDGRVDLFWKRSSGSGALQFWQGTGSAFNVQASTNYPYGWAPVGGIQ